MHLMYYHIHSPVFDRKVYEIGGRTQNPQRRGNVAFSRSRVGLRWHAVRCLYKCKGARVPRPVDVTHEANIVE